MRECFGSLMWNRLNSGKLRIYTETIVLAVNYSKQFCMFARSNVCVIDRLPTKKLIQ